MSIGYEGDKRGSGAPTLLFWLGAGLAALAALILLAVPGNTALRIGTVFGLLAVVLIGLSTPRRAPETGAVNQETIRLVDEKLQALQAEVQALRTDVHRDTGARTGARSPAVGWTDAAYRPDTAPVRGSSGITSSATYPAHVPEPEFAGSYHDAGRFSAASPSQPGRPGSSSGHASVPPPTGRHPVAAGVVRHTETIRVTTRQTIVEPDADRQGNVYGSTHASGGTGWTAPRQRSCRSAEPEQDWSPADGQPDWADDDPEREPVEGRHEREWASGRRSTAGRARSRYEADAPAGAAEAVRPATTRPESRSWGADDRWASVRDDADGRELRVGRRRAAVRADEIGTEMRVEDRWAAVRQTYQGEQWADSGGVDWSGGRDRSGAAANEWIDRDLGARWEERSHGDQPALSDDGAGADRPSTRRVWQPRVPASLPARSSAESWRDRWAEPEPEPTRSPRSDSREVGFGRSDVRWG